MTDQVPKERPWVEVGPAITLKHHPTEQDARTEARWFRRVPWATPVLLDVCGSTLVMQTLPCAWMMPEWQPVEALHDLIMRLFAEDIHHRDVHPGNIVRGADGLPRLVDWETAIEMPAPESYDLKGKASGVPDPERHLLAGYSQWWKSSSPCSIEKVWLSDVSAQPDLGVPAPLD